MTKPDRRGRFGRWLEGEQPLFDEERSVLLDFDGLEPDQPQKAPSTPAPYRCF